jgi:two-component system sensor histidine kinase BaeS
VKLTLLESGDLPEVQVDPDRMMQVLSNLVSNALRHTAAGGVVSLQSSVRSDRSSVISDQPATRGRQSVANGQPEPDYWILITVSDNGEGIAPEVMPHIFDRFYRGDQARQEGEGESGLGLAIAHSIVEMHGGELQVHSEGLGKGTTFSVYLPVTEAIREL